jgi:hypothetical protein
VNLFHHISRRESTCTVLVRICDHVYKRNRQLYVPYVFTHLHLNNFQWITQNHLDLVRFGSLRVGFQQGVSLRWLNDNNPTLSLTLEGTWSKILNPNDGEGEVITLYNDYGILRRTSDRAGLPNRRAYELSPIVSDKVFHWKIVKNILLQNNWNI